MTNQTRDLRVSPGEAGFMPHIEGLRAVAVLLVLLYHAGFSFIPGGFVGVDVFFVISGFLITGLLLREWERSGSISFAGFYARRVRRLLPISTLVLAVTTLGAWFLLPPLRWASTALDVLASALGAANLRFALNQVDYLTANDAPSAVLHYWSLGVEEQFYLFWPALVLVSLQVARSYRPRLVLGLVSLVVLLGSFALSFRWTGAMQPYAFFLLPSRAWELAAGALLAAAYPLVQRLPGLLTQATGTLGLFALVGASVRFDDSLQWPGLAAALPVLATLLLVAAPGWVRRVLTLAPMRAVGRWSYSLYLWHWPLLIFAPFFLKKTLTVADSVLVLLLALLLSAATFRFVEQPLRQAPRLSFSSLRSLSFGAALVTSALFSGFALQAAPFPEPVRSNVTNVASGLPVSTIPRAESPSYEALLTAARSVTVVPVDLTPDLRNADDDRFVAGIGDCFGDTTALRAPAYGCYFGDRSSASTIALIGDSHAAQWSPALDVLARDNGLRLLVLAKSACPAAHLNRNGKKYGKYPQCDTWNASLMQRLRTERPLVTIVAGYAGYAVSTSGSVTAYKKRSWEKLFGELKSFTTPLLLADTPYPNTDLPECLSLHLDDVTACVRTRAQMSTATPGLKAERLAAQTSGVAVVDTFELVCPTTRCPVIVGNILVYRDESHISASFSRWLAEPLGKLLAPYLPIS